MNNEVGIFPLLSFRTHMRTSRLCYAVSLSNAAIIATPCHLTSLKTAQLERNLLHPTLLLSGFPPDRSSHFQIFPAAAKLAAQVLGHPPYFQERLHGSGASVATTRLIADPQAEAGRFSDLAD